MAVRIAAKNKRKPSTDYRGAHGPRDGKAAAGPKWLLAILLAIVCLAWFYLFVRPRTLQHAPRPSASVSDEWSNEGCQESIRHQQAELLRVFEESLRGHQHVAILGHPDHENKGDSAIWTGEKVLMAALGKQTVYQSCWRLYSHEKLRQVIHEYPDLVIMLHGGGNFGDLYMWELRPRFQVVEEFPEVPIRFFPQSIHFDSQKNIELVTEMLADHSDLQLFVRDIPSLNFAKREFGPRGVHVRYSPDCAFLIGERPDLREQAEQTHDVLIFHRTDVEGHEWTQNLTAWDPELRVLEADWFDYAYNIPDANSLHYDARSYARFKKGAEFLLDARISIVDRLHGHIVAMLLGIPHIIVDNRIGKLSAYRNSWTAGCKLAKVASSPAEAQALALQYLAKPRPT